MCDSSSVFPTCIPHSPPHCPTTATCCYCTIQAPFWLIDHHIVVLVFPSFRVWVWILLLTLSVFPFSISNTTPPCPHHVFLIPVKKQALPPKLTKYTLTAQEVALAIPSGQMQVMLSEFFSWMQVPPCWQGHLLGSGNSVSTAESQQKQGQQSFLALPLVW